MTLLVHNDNSYSYISLYSKLDSHILFLSSSSHIWCWLCTWCTVRPQKVRWVFGPAQAITSSMDMECGLRRVVLADTLPNPTTSIFSTSKGSNLVGDSPTVDTEVPSDISGLDWKEEMEEDVSSVIDGMKGVLSCSWPGAPFDDNSIELWLVPGSADLWIPCRFFRCFVRSPKRNRVGKNYVFETIQRGLTFVSKLVSTNMTLEWALPCVAAIVVFQFAARLKTLLAHITHKSIKCSII